MDYFATMLWNASWPIVFVSIVVATLSLILLCNIEIPRSRKDENLESWATVDKLYNRYLKTIISCGIALILGWSIPDPSPPPTPTLTAAQVRWDKIYGLCLQNAGISTQDIEKSKGIIDFCNKSASWQLRLLPSPRKLVK